MKIFQKMKDFFVRISGFLRIFAVFPGFLRISADFNFLSQFFIFIFCKKIYIFFFYFWVFLLKSVQKILSQFSKIPKVNVPEDFLGFPLFSGFIRKNPDFLFLVPIFDKFFIFIFL